MGYVLRLLLPAAATWLLLAPAAVAAPKAHSAAAQKRAEAALQEVEQLNDGRGVRTGRELSDALRELAVGVRHLRGAEREQAVALLSRPTDFDAAADERFDPALPVTRSCLGDFCVHYVLTGTDAATPAYVATVLAEAAKVHTFENSTLGWREPPADAPLGGGSQVDIYLKELSTQNMFGFAASDPGQGTQSQHSYLVIDNDFDPAQYSGVPALDSLRLTLAHEYGHVLQYGYDITADSWHYESSAVWLEHRMDPALDDWLSFVYDGTTRPGWRSLTELPLTSFDDPSDERNSKAYGSAVWNHFLSGRYGSRGDQLQRSAWEQSDGLSAPSTRSYDLAIKGAGGTGLAADFAGFAAAVAEWRVPEMGFALPAQLPDVERRGALPADGAGTTTSMDHLTFALYDVPDTTAGAVRLAASFPAGVHGALALVGRSGPPGSGPVTTRIVELPTGGTGGVTLERPHSFYEAGGRITAVLVNADASQRGYGQNGWVWSRDDQNVAAAVTSDAAGPAVASRTPGPDATRVATGSRVRVTFSKPVSGVSSQTFFLTDARGTAVPAAVAYDPATRTATLTPAAPLADTSRYTATLTSGIADSTAATLPPTQWTFSTVKQRPRARLAVRRASTDAVRLALISSDVDRLRWSAKLVAGGRTLARKAGRVRPGATRTASLAARNRTRARLVVVLEDPQGNRRRIVRALRLRR